MENLPDELIVHTLSFLEPDDIITAQSVSRRFLAVARDASLWKTVWWDPAHAPPHRHNGSTEENRPLSFLSMRPMRRSLATPALPGEKLDFYDEYIAAHAPICTSWICKSWTDRGLEKDHNNVGFDEAIGLGVYYNDTTQRAELIFAPMDDGSICTWDINRDSSAKRGEVVSRTRPGLLRESSRRFGVMGAASRVDHGSDGVSIDWRSKRGYFAVSSVLNEVDLQTMQIISEHNFPSDILTLSEARYPIPLTVGTTETIHLHDVRQSDVSSGPDFSLRCEFMTDADARSSICDLDLVSLSKSSVCQHKPLSILHLPLPGAAEVSNSIWVAGRFPSLLRYDRRYFPKLAGNIYSGGDISSLTYLTNPFVDWDSHTYCDGTDTTIVAAGGYKGKGSLELYGVNAECGCTLPRQPSTTNRNYSSIFRILSIATQGARLVGSDGNGNINWWYRDGRTKARTYNINDPPRNGASSIQDNVDHVYDQYASDVPSDDWEPRQPDIAWKIKPSIAPGLSSSAGSTTGTRGINEEDLIISTDNGRIGLVGFGEANALEPEWHEAAENAAEVEHHRQEKMYGSMMRQALEEHTRELNWMRGLGLAP
ncbi:uncharacterized protein J3D65DRAFT_616631 [Phyllosticta citribraziliensis]|uniref:F-box domain-containing protein n=1 Tax=Phyllosticta citribraziliensis TaxID=989973 RepID=A0ABR1M1U9_9PEZI